MSKRLAALLAAAAILPFSAGAEEPYNVASDGDWPRYARDLEGTRFSPLDQIDTKNVGQLEASVVVPAASRRRRGAARRNGADRG